MDKEIKRLLKLSNIPNFTLSKAEMEKLVEWKRQQRRIKTTKKIGRIIPEGYMELEGVGANGENALIATSEAPEATKKKKTTRKSSRTKKVQNVVVDKEIGEIAEES